MRSITDVLNEVETKEELEYQLKETYGMDIEAAIKQGIITESDIPKP